LPFNIFDEQKLFRIYPQPIAIISIKNEIFPNWGKFPWEIVAKLKENNHVDFA
jgi:hypothetical protein